nr:hypothetical protein BaRGS_018741 [Batillaria attramentaria]
MYNMSVTWSEAARACARNRQQLVIMDTYTELSLQIALENNQQLLEQFWINFFDSDMGTGYIRGDHVRWADGTPMAWTNWAESEPRLTGSGACGTANGTSLQWGTDDCTGGRHGFMCQSWGL